MSEIPEQYTIDDNFLNLVNTYQGTIDPVPNLKKVETIKVNFVVSAAASFYETIRNAVEYREQHLLRRAAVERMLKRLIYLQTEPETIAETLVRELIWAKYLPNDVIPETKVASTALIIRKALLFWKSFNANNSLAQNKRKLFDFLISILSCEIEEFLFDARKREALYQFANHILVPHIQFDPAPFTTEEKSLIIATALRKAVLKADYAQLSYNLFKTYFPSWVSANPDFTSISLNYVMAYKKINEILDAKITEKIFYYCRSNTPPFFVLEDALEHSPVDVMQKSKSSSYLSQLVQKVTEERYRKIRRKLTTATTRSIVYIFFTKMFFAFLLEFPYERFIIDEINYRNLLINLVVPPAIMFLVTLTIRVPGEKNTRAIQNYVRSIVYKEIPDDIVDYKERKRLHKTKQLIFGSMYSIGFFVTFGLILYFLVSLDYNFVSGVIFVLFLTLVSFFGFMIRQQVRDIKLGKERQTILESLADFFAFPIIRTGSLLSTEFAKLNITVYIFDLFIEAPFKTIIQLFEEWFSFVRERKDEIV